MALTVSGARDAANLSRLYRNNQIQTGFTNLYFLILRLHRATLNSVITASSNQILKGDRKEKDPKQTLC